MDTKTCIKLLKEAQRNDGIAATDENRDSLIQLCQMGLLDCMGVAPKGESKARKSTSLPMTGAKRLMPMKRLKHSYIRELLPFQV